MPQPFTSRDKGSNPGLDHKRGSTTPAVLALCINTGFQSLMAVNPAPFSTTKFTVQDCDQLPSGSVSAAVFQRMELEALSVHVCLSHRPYTDYYKWMLV